MTRVSSIVRRYLPSSSPAVETPPGFTERTATSALRLLEVTHSAEAVTVVVEVQSTGPWSNSPWAGASVHGGVHILSPDGSTLDHNGPRSDAFELRWARLREPVFAVSTPRDRLHGAGGLEVDLVVEGVAWGSDRGIPTLRVPLEGALPAGPVRRPGRGVPAWPISYEKVVADLCSAWPEGASPSEMNAYATADTPRFLFTVQLVVAGKPTRCLEIGANPYFTSRLLRGADPNLVVRGTNWFGTQPGPDEQAVVDASGTEIGRFPFDLVDVEIHDFPHDDGAFDVVLFGEVIEHLIADPVHALSEIHRVLEPGGRLVLTTPNVARAENIVKLATQRSIYDPYSSYGPHGRHNREYSAAELFELIEGNGFDLVRHVTRPVHGVTDLPPAWFEAADDDGRGDYHFIEATRARRSASHRPVWLYR